jgi:chromosome segregation ATPase|tara:strand:- start:1037 stop:1663 length:627 start_codon:yes stop_codon:yes gene_type:complete
MLKDEQVKKKKELIDTTTTRMDELTKNYDDMRKSIAESREEIKNLRLSIAEEERKLSACEGTMQVIKNEHQPLAILVQETEKVLEQDAFDKKVLAHTEEHPDFYVALESRLKKIQDDHRETMELLFRFVKPELVIAVIRKTIEAERQYNQTSVNYRTAKATYERSIKEICTIKANGGKPSFQAAKMISVQLDQFLEAGDVIHLWHKQL